ncbi:bifunctional DNA-formamidopyrimidine glycosylase/DNA-(apurinic or apyrimidinic site) lyase [Candidatus Poriferisodalis sp.]|uniref:bifunctional DNA-formamidopyrimidine glycosylase/DNA-(apurinic or apyrimidinic site) lyase n=1 Tax=Candidatus Poriferisodalis sp. TaxID=3101277 RepID=UPI003C6F92B0
MPELPEVEVVRRQLERPLLGRQIAEAWAHPSPKFVSGPDAVGSEVEALRRRGKYLIAELDCGRDLVVHLGMTGRLCFAWRADAAGAPHDSSPQTLAVRPLDGPAADVMGDAIGDVTAAGKLAERYSIGRSDPYVRAWWHLDNGEVLCLHDVRRFGRVAVCDRGDYRDLPTLAAMGPEPLDPRFDAEAFWRASRRSSQRIKTQLLNQRLVAGIGNIYADEALFLARIDPSARTISKPRAERLLAALRDVLVASIERGGSTLRDYYSLEGAGDNQKYFVCYGRAGEPCVRCGTEMRRRVLDQRSSTWCPSCQYR